MRRFADSQVDTIETLRSDALQLILDTCNTAVARVAKRKQCTRSKSKRCAAARIGYLMMTLTDMGLFPTPADAYHMQNSVIDYWKGLKKLQKYQEHFAQVVGHEFYSSQCVWYPCMGDFYIQENMLSMLKKHAHPHVRKLCGVL
jgi:hypothetical protein